MRRIISLLDPRIKKINNSKYFYALDKRDSRIVRCTGLLGLLSLGFLVAGYINFLHISMWADIVFAPLFLLLTLYFLIQSWLFMQYPGFDVRKHHDKVLQFKKATRANHTYPTVAVLIPAAGEDKDMVASTVRAALAIDYPKYAVYILDDSKNAIYADLAPTMGCQYIRRSNVGYQQKSGNLNHALVTLKGYQYFLILDADFKPRREILNELVPYADEDVGIVQSPQHFPLTADVYKRSKIEYGAAYIQQDFYRILQVARNKFGAAICVGTNALYNVAALKKVHGFEGVGAPRGWGHSEDVHTGLKIIHERNAIGKRYRIQYVPVQLAEGYCPDKHHSFYKQQNRWCTGSVQLLFTKKTTFSSTLSLSQRLIYSSNALYYYYTIAMLAAPLYLLVLTLIHRDGAWRYTALFLPAIITNLLITPYLLRREQRPLAVTLVVLSNAYTFLQALIMLIRRRPLRWEATGALQSGRSTHFTYYKLIVVFVFTLLYLPTFGAILLDDKLQFSPTIFITSMFLLAFLAHIAFLYYILIINGNKQRRFADRKFYAALVVAALIVAVGFFGIHYHGIYQITFNHHSVVAFDKTVPSPTGITVSRAR